MLDRIARVLEPLLRFLWPPPCIPATPAHDPPEPAPVRAPEPYFRGEDTALVRPYFVAHERRQAEARRQRGRRRVLWLAVHGIDVGPRVIHGRQVVA